MEFQFQIEGWHAGLRPGNEADQEWQISGSPPNPEPNAGGSAQTSTVTMPRMLNRRLGKLPKIAASGAVDLPNVQDATYVVCSRHGDFDRVLRLLHSLSDEEGLSPTDFSLSVHNMLAGVLSIAAGNTEAHTAIAAGSNTFVFGVMEVLTLLASGRAQSAMLLYYDAPLPGEYAGLESQWEINELALVVAFSSVEPSQGDEQSGAITRSYTATLLLGGDGVSATEAGSVTQAEAFIQFLKNPGLPQESRGTRIGWRWSQGVAQTGQDHV
ncbi:MAG: hypothetical protein HOK21_03170 [Rhodospirillaceae bacterium]|jgi:hypothetical protein|nr:hypothetical protein [Rhodospirillaceae bacterium]MBT6825749.1 hypothetical protein [Rhodospirillales bacterium]